MDKENDLKDGNIYWKGDHSTIKIVPQTNYLQELMLILEETQSATPAGKIKVLRQVMENEYNLDRK